MALEWVIAKGQVGAVRYGRASDADGYVDLSQFDSVHFIAHSRLSSNPVINDEVTVIGDQSDPNVKGKFSYTFDVTTANVPARQYNYCALKCMDGTVPTYFPLDSNSDRSYFKLTVQDSVG